MKKSPVTSLLVLLSLVVSTVGWVPVAASEDQQAEIYQELARELLDNMTPDERVGQLLLVSFSGSIADNDSEIYELITEHHVGGVILLAQNNNFNDAPDTIVSAYQLIASLQMAEWDSGRNGILGSGKEIPDEYIPLFIGISQDGDGYPNDQILSGLTNLPALMSLGATWEPELAEQAGVVNGRELASIGFNLFLGPSLDVLESSSTTPSSGLGTAVFGGDPFWVGKMGEAYIAGLHQGSDGKMAVVAKHFPGRGGADRPSGDEVATVRKSLEQLKQIELAPFFSVTGKATSADGIADGLLVSHIRYQGFQGNIRATTRPVSFDTQALAQILALSEFSTWRQNGGIIVSDDLGSNTVRRFYDPSGVSFSAKLVARDAFLAGNDLLYLGNIVSSDQPDTYSSVLQIIEYFTRKYQEDPAFAQKVDESVLRILTLKFKIYSNFSLSQVIQNETLLGGLGVSDGVTFNVAGNAATLISPAAEDLPTSIPAPPDDRERILFLTDTLMQRQCDDCLVTPVMSIDALQRAVLRLYGPQGAGLVYPSRLMSYPLDDLDMFLLGNTTEGEGTLSYDLGLADWVVISLVDPAGEESISVLRRFLSERQDLLRDKTIVVFAFNSPNFLDATDISKLTVYYGLFSKSDAFVEIAARLLFQELTPSGALPISVSGIGYDLLSVTAPDPEQVIVLTLENYQVVSMDGDDLVTPVPSMPLFTLGEKIGVSTEIIVDHNGNPVPDGTGVVFKLIQNGEDGVIQQSETFTVAGVARAAFNIERPGIINISASSYPALTSVVLQLEVGDDEIDVTALVPAQSITPATPSPVVLITSTPSVDLSSAGHMGFIRWLAMLIITFATSVTVLWIGQRFVPIQWAFRWTLSVFLGGVLAYGYTAFKLPGTDGLLLRLNYWGTLFVVVWGMILGLCVGVLWMFLARKRKSG